MIQKKFLCKDMESAKLASKEIGRIIKDTPHKCALVTFYENGLPKDDVASVIDNIKNCGISGIMTAGMKETVVVELLPEGTGILLNLILTQEASIEVVTIPCSDGGEEEAAAKLRSRLDANENVKAVELFGSNMSLSMTEFMQKSMQGHEDAVLFGTSTLRNLSQRVNVEESDSSFEIEKIGEDMERDEIIIGDEIVTDGFVAVIFSGESLNVLGEYALGWNPVGRDLSLEFGPRPSKGETLVTSVNGAPAVDIYREYLGVYPDQFLISNVCEFPFVVEREGINICLIPVDFDRDGNLYFMMKLEAGEKVRFTFASHDEVLNASRVSLERMERFAPEALFLTLCGNRINFLKEDAHIEWDEFSSVSPDFALMHGACELYYHNGKGGILNSAHLAIGMREGDAASSGSVHEHRSVESLRQGRMLSLSDRMSVFLSKITTELLDMAQEAKDANNAKSAFLSHMSHEIRTPINAVLGMNEMILQDSKENETLEYAESIRSAGNNLLTIVNDILDLSKIEAGKMNIIPVEYELSSVINDLNNIVGLRASDKGLVVKIDIDPSTPSVLYGDETRIKQVITNLLTNAVKYTEKGTVTLCVKPVSIDGKSLILSVSVKDTGIGIRPEDMENLFEEYERFEEKRNRRIEGTGLGLSITRQLLELMDSRLTVKSKYGEGSEFGFELLQGIVDETPVGDLSGRFKRSAIKKYRVRFTAEDARILVVDDTPVNLVVVKNLLKKTKIGIDTAKSGQEALMLVTQNHYDLIFLDHMMPNMDGPETLAKMKELEGNKCEGVPVISLTANAGVSARDEYIRAGFRDYLAKPISQKDIEDMLFYYIPPEKIRTIPLDREE